MKLDEAKKRTYNAGFSFGKMLIGPYKGEKVSIAKPKEKQDMIEAKEALVYFEPEKYVESRSGVETLYIFPYTLSSLFIHSIYSLFVLRSSYYISLFLHYSSYSVTNVF